MVALLIRDISKEELSSFETIGVFKLRNKVTLLSWFICALRKVRLN